MPASRFLFIPAAITLLSASSVMAGQYDSYAFALEGYYDHYQEPDPALQVDTHAQFGGISLGWMRNYEDSAFYHVLEGRASIGLSDYKSVSGYIDNVVQYEYEFRGLAGLQADTAIGVLNIYSGLGSRLFFDELSGERTNLGFLGYDRDIYQFYVPLGLGWHITVGNWRFSPTVEADYVFYGRVNSRLKPIIGYDANNTQDSGYGLRGEFMVGKNGDDYSWQIGPYFRYWKVKDSQFFTSPDGSVMFYEPENERLQIGGKLRFIF